MTQPCYNNAVTLPVTCSNPAQFAYWDPFHPTEAAGKYMTDIMLKAIGR